MQHSPHLSSLARPRHFLADVLEDLSKLVRGGRQELIDFRRMKALREKLLTHAAQLPRDPIGDFIEICDRDLAIHGGEADRKLRKAVCEQIERDAVLRKTLSEHDFLLMRLGLLPDFHERGRGAAQ